MSTAGFVVFLVDVIDDPTESSCALHSQSEDEALSFADVTLQNDGTSRAPRIYVGEMKL